MTHTPHDLHAEFPNDVAILHDLKLGDMHFNRRAEAYHNINREIHRIDAGIDAASDAHTEELKKSRLALLDEIADMIAVVRKGA
ncbi:MAG: DUF465 domain-containing protein [Chakrabartia sp.]